MAEDNPRPIRIPKKRKQSAPAPAKRGAEDKSAENPARESGAPAEPKKKARPKRIAAKDQSPQQVKPTPSTPRATPDAHGPVGVKEEISSSPVSPQTSPRPAPGVTIAENQAAGGQDWAEGVKLSLWTMPAWMLSLLVHVVVLLGLALVTAAVIEKEPEVVISTSISAAEDEAIEDFSEIEMEEPEELVQEETLFQPDMPEMPKLTFDEAAMAPSETVVDGQPTPVSATSGSAGELASTAGSPRRGSETGKAVTFYGSKSKGNRFVFLIDNSPNMNNEGRMLMALDQLLRAVNQMSAKQVFYVVFYSNRAYPLFFPEEAEEMVEATRKNKEKLERWLTTVELCDSRPGGSAAIEATLQIARRLNPSTVFFLTDGDYARKVASELTENSLGAPLNVIGLMPSKVTNQSERDAVEKLQEFARLAEENDGSFSPVPSTSSFPADTFAERRKDRPGPVWGTYR